ncbi:MAG: GNAT family N-acetyltransferase [Bacteroidales bacterium]|nr:GNAT family N-acetyltransferase [Bacteroidales bacterium]
MKIELAKTVDLIDVYYLFKECAKDMNQRGAFHWNQYYPSMDLIDQQIKKEALYIIKHLGVCVGCMVLNDNPLSEFKEISWSSGSQKNLNIQWLAIHPMWKDKDIDSQLIKFADDFAKEKGFDSIRLNVHASNEVNQKTYNSNGYNEKGEVYMPFQKTPFKCFEKLIK